MGVDHGDRKDMSPRIWSSRDANPNCLPRVLSYRYKKERSVAFKIRQNPISAETLPRTPLRELTSSQDPLVGWRGDAPPIPHPYSAPTHLRRSPCVPQNSSQIYAYGNC